MHQHSLTNPLEINILIMQLGVWSPAVTPQHPALSAFTVWRVWLICDKLSKIIRAMLLLWQFGNTARISNCPLSSHWLLCAHLPLSVSPLHTIVMKQAASQNLFWKLYNLNIRPYHYLSKISLSSSYYLGGTIHSA